MANKAENTTDNKIENKIENTTDNKPKMVKIMVPIVQGQTGDIHPCVNGEEYTIKRGEYVEVPWYIAEIVQNSIMQEQKVLRRIEELRKK